MTTDADEGRHQQEQREAREGLPSQDAVDEARDKLAAGTHERGEDADGTTRDAADDEFAGEDGR